MGERIAPEMEAKGLKAYEQARAYERIRTWRLPLSYALAPVVPAALGAVAWRLGYPALFAGGHGLRSVGQDEPADTLFERREGDDPFERTTPFAPDMPQMKTCIECHSSPGVYSMLSMTRGFRDNPKNSGELFRTYSWDVEMKLTVQAKAARFDWGLLKGKLEAK